jgi:hypothetical protein
MVQADGVEVYLERYDDGFRYNEHTPPPGTKKHTGNPNEKYVEVNTDERFRICVKLLSGFNFMNYPSVRVSYYVDRDGCTRLISLSKRRPEGLDPTSRWHREDHFDEVERFIGGQYMHCGFTFGELKLGMFNLALLTGKDMIWLTTTYRRGAPSRRSTSPRGI